MPKHKAKQIYLFGGSEEKQIWELMVEIRETSYKFSGHFLFPKPENEEKHGIRVRDRTWVRNNIPSSIQWYTEIHHDWEDGGRMYLLSEKEHKRKHR